ncbi:MAG: UDP-glucose 4-epimerase GalE [Gemmataceae bacterium]
MRILVTGGAGYIGSHTVKLLLAKGHTVTVFDSLIYGHRQAVPEGVNFIQGDLRDIDMLDHAMVVNRIEAVIHFAALAYVGESVTNPSKYYVNNLVYTANLIDRIRKLDIKKFVFSSTCATYGIPASVPIDESFPQNPVNPYGNTKLAIERMLSDYCRPYGISATALRYFNASGAAADGSLGEDHTPETHLIPLVLDVALGLRPHVEIFGTDYPTPDGTCIRDYIHVEDLASAHLLALEKMTPGEYRALNIGTGKGYSVRDVITTAELVTGSSIKTVESARRAGDPPALVASGDKARKELGWAPQYVDLKRIIETAWNWRRKHPKGYEA